MYKIVLQQWWSLSRWSTIVRCTSIHLNIVLRHVFDKTLCLGSYQIYPNNLFLSKNMHLRVLHIKFHTNVAMSCSTHQGLRDKYSLFPSSILWSLFCTSLLSNYTQLVSPLYMLWKMKEIVHWMFFLPPRNTFINRSEAEGFSFQSIWEVKDSLIVTDSHII